MDEQSSWYNQDTFWELVAPVIFGPQRHSSAPLEVEKVVNLLQIEQRDRVLDLCCGIGRHSLEFARQGMDVVGVDRTAGFIEQARQVAERDNLDVQFVVGDMREYCVRENFNVVLNLFGSFGYFDDPQDDRKVVKNMFASLQPGGKLLIETMGKEILARQFLERDWTEVGDLLLLSEKTICPAWRSVQTRWIAIKGTQRFEYQVSVRSYSAVELASLLSTCGFAQVGVYGDLDGSAYDQAAKRLVVVGHK